MDGIASVLLGVLTGAALGVLCVLGYYGPLLVLLLVHETVHAITARLLGLRLLGLEVGSGPQLLRFRLLGCDWVLRPVPSHGLVRAVLGSPAGYRTRWVLVYLSAPVVCAVLAAATVVPVVRSLKLMPGLLCFPVGAAPLVSPPWPPSHWCRGRSGSVASRWPRICSRRGA